MGRISKFILERKSFLKVTCLKYIGKHHNIYQNKMSLHLIMATDLIQLLITNY